MDQGKASEEETGADTPEERPNEDLSEQPSSSNFVPGSLQTTSNQLFAENMRILQSYCQNLLTQSPYSFLPPAYTPYGLPTPLLYGNFQNLFAGSLMPPTTVLPTFSLNNLPQADNKRKNELECVELAMEQLSMDEPQIMDSQSVQRKLEEMRELLYILHSSRTFEKVMDSFDQFEYTYPKMEVFEKALRERYEFSTNYTLYEYTLRANIRKLETSRSIKLSDLYPLREEPKLVDFNKYREI